MNVSYGIYKKNITQSQQQEQALQQNYTVLQQERQDIEKIIRDFQTIDSAEENGDIKVTINYYKYIILLFVVFLLILLFIKFTVSSDQIGGGNNYSIHKVLDFFDF